MYVRGSLVLLYALLYFSVSLATPILCLFGILHETGNFNKKPDYWTSWFLLIYGTFLTLKCLLCLNLAHSRVSFYNYG